MKRTTLLLAAALVAASPAAMAQGKGHGNGNGHGKPGNGPANHSASVPGNCPPGLAKKNPPCVPPGLAKNSPDYDHDDHYDDHRHDGDVVIYDRGDRIPDGYVVVQDPAYFGLDPRYEYYRVGDSFYRIDQDTQEVIAFVGALADLLN